MADDQTNRNQQDKPGPTNPQKTTTQGGLNTQNISTTFTEIHENTLHIAEQTDRIAEHLLDGQSTPRRQAARSLLAQLNQITRNQALMIDMMEEMLRRLPPMPEQGKGTESTDR